MALTREQKESILRALEDVFARAKTVVFVNFHGLGVSDADALRRSLREQNVTYLVAKKTLLKRALGSVAISGERPLLEGEIAIAYGDDEVVPASGMAAFIKRHKEALAIVGGVFEKRFVGRAEMEAIAAIPSLDVLRGMFVNVINSPIQGLAVALSEIAKAKD